MNRYLEWLYHYYEKEELKERLGEKSEEYGTALRSIDKTEKHCWICWTARKRSSFFAIWMNLC